MAEEEVIPAASPAPTDHKRKHEELDSEPFEKPPAAADTNGNSESVADVDADTAPAGVLPEDFDVKRPHLDNKPDESATENGHQEERTGEPKENITEPAVVEKGTEPEEDPAKADEPLDATHKESLAVEAHKSAIDLQSAGKFEESAKVENQELIEGHKEPSMDVTKLGDASVVEQPSSSDKLTSRKMEVPSNKVGVLIGKAGDNIRTLQYSSGARIQVTRDADADPHSSTRPVELIGSLENINKAEKLIKDVIAEADAGGSPSLVARGCNVQSSGSREQVQIQVPIEKVGLIIGKGGETIKNLQTRSGARIQLIPQHLPEGDQSKERTVRVTGDRRQIEIAKEMIKEAMDQPVRSSAPSSGNNHQTYRSRGPGPQWGPRGHPSQPTGYNNYPPRGSYPSQSPQYSSQSYGNYPPQQPPPRNNYGWEHRPPTNMQGPPEPTGYDYYGGQGGHRAAPSPQPPMHSHAPGPVMGPPPSQLNYNYGQPQGPGYGQQPSPYPQTAPPQGYGHGYGEPKYDQGPGPQPYGGQGSQPSTYPQGTTHQGYVQQDQYGKPPAYNMPQQGPYAQFYSQPRQQPYPYASSGPAPQAYPQYGAAPAPAPAPAANDGYNQAAPAPGGYSQPSGQPVSGYAPQIGGQQQTPGYAQAGPATSYGQYPSTQPGYNEQAAATNTGYGYQGAADPAYGGGGQGMAYGAPPAVQPAYSQPASASAPAPAPVPAPVPAPLPVPAQPGYDQSVPQTGSYVTPQPQPQQPGYAQYDSQMYAGHR